jgi:hypothetical protein
LSALSEFRNSTIYGTRENAIFTLRLSGLPHNE